MSSKLQLDVCCLSCGGDIWWTLMKERQAWCCLHVKLCDPCLSALCVPWCKKALYKYSSFPFLFQLVNHDINSQNVNNKPPMMMPDSYILVDLVVHLLSKYRNQVNRSRTTTAWLPIKNSPIVPFRDDDFTFQSFVNFTQEMSWGNFWKFLVEILNLNCHREKV